MQELRNDAELQEGNLGWLKARMAVLIEICADNDGHRQGSALSKLSTDFKGLLASLLEVSEAFTTFIKVSDTTRLLGLYSIISYSRTRRQKSVAGSLILLNWNSIYHILTLYFSVLSSRLRKWY